MNMCMMESIIFLQIQVLDHMPGNRLNMNGEEKTSLKRSERSARSEKREKSKRRK